MALSSKAAYYAVQGSYNFCVWIKSCGVTLQMKVLHVAIL